MVKFQVLGKGCSKCIALGENAAAAARALGMEYQIEKVTGINAIIDAGVMTTPALAINGEVKSAGRVLSVDEVIALLQ